MRKIHKKDMIIKLKLPDENLEQLLDICTNAGVSLPELFENFIYDLIDDTREESPVMTDWLYRTAQPKAAANEEKEDEKLIHFSNQQVEIMNLLDLILDS